MTRPLSKKPNDPTRNQLKNLWYLITLFSLGFLENGNISTFQIGPSPFGPKG